MANVVFTEPAEYDLLDIEYNYNIPKVYCKYFSNIRSVFF